MYTVRESSAAMVGSGRRDTVLAELVVFPSIPMGADLCASVCTVEHYAPDVLARSFGQPQAITGRPRDAELRPRPSTHA